MQAYSYLNRLQSPSVLILLTLSYVISRLQWPCIARISQFRQVTSSKVCLYDFFSPYESYTLFQPTALHTYAPHIPITWKPFDSLYHLYFLLTITLRLNSSTLTLFFLFTPSTMCWRLFFVTLSLQSPPSTRTTSGHHSFLVIFTLLTLTFSRTRTSNRE